MNDIIIIFCIFCNFFRTYFYFIFCWYCYSVNVFRPRSWYAQGHIFSTLALWLLLCSLEADASLLRTEKGRWSQQEQQRQETSPPAGALLAEAGTQMVPFACSRSSSDPHRWISHGGKPLHVFPCLLSHRWPVVSASEQVQEPSSYQYFMMLKACLSEKHISEKQQYFTVSRTCVKI